MNPESGSFAMCVRHPSQFFTGFCSSCLVERLSNVETVERSPKPYCSQHKEPVDLSIELSDFERKPRDLRVRTTLLSLFNSDDGTDVEKKEHAAKDQFGIEKLTVDNVRLSENGYKASVSPYRSCSKHVQVGLNCDPGTRFLESSDKHESRVYGSCSVAGDVSFDPHVVEKLDPLEDENLKDKAVPSWLSSMFSKKVLRWGVASASKKKSMHERSWSVGFAHKRVESKVDFRHSCDWRVSRDSSKASWEDPRHSWDGSMMSRAFACSFGCVEEAQDSSFRIKRSIPGEAMFADPNPSIETNDTSKVDNVILAEEKPLSPDGSSGGPLRDMFHEESHHDIAVSVISRRKSHRWSKLWCQSITSPFRDFGKKREHILERSLSESWRECPKGKNMETTGSDGGVHFHANGLGSSRTNHCSDRSINAGNGDLQNLRPDWQKKREYKLGRSRSVHYPSPGNVDNGLLRFYLTPLRSSRRSTSTGRRKSSRFFGRGVLGLY